jgi:hypothetical protein
MATRRGRHSQTTASAPKTQAHAEVEIEKAHVENPAIGQHGDARQQVPGRPSAHHGDKPEGSPDEHQHGNRDRDALRRFGAEQAEQAAQHEVEQNIRGLADDHQSLRAPGFDQLGQPRVVDVTGEIAGLHPRLPVNRSQQQDGQRCTTTFALAILQAKFLELRNQFERRSHALDGFANCRIRSSVICDSAPRRAASCR